MVTKVSEIVNEQSQQESRNARLDEVQRYELQRERVEQQFNALGYGFKKKAAFALDIHPNLINAVLSGRLVSAEKLARMDEWSQATLREQGKS